MKAHRLFLFAILAVVLPVSSALATDEGQTRPRLNSATITSPNTTVDLIPLTNGAGNLKGVHCIFDTAAYYRDQQVDIYVDGGAAQSLVIHGLDFPREGADAGRSSTGFIPMNVRFESSLRVQLRRFSSPGVVYFVTCEASWALD